MNLIQHDGEITRLIQKRLEMFHSVLLAQIQPKLILQLFMYIPMLQIGYIRIAHKRDQVEDQVGGLSEDGECREAKVFEASVVWG